MLEWFQQARQKLERDRHLGLPVVAAKSLRFAQELVTAQLYLRSATLVGKGVRTLGRPRIQNFGRLVIGDGCLLRSINVPVELAVEEGAVLELGREVRLNYGVSIGATGSIRLGDRVRVGPYAMIIDTEFHDAYDRNKRPPPRPVVIEDDAWIGAKASIMPGVTVGKGAIVSTGAVVAADVAAFTVVAGNPARAVRKLDPALFVGG
jgi:acetyltransferase-like isoleucine patch superfamily enzyme